MPKLRRNWTGYEEDMTKTFWLAFVSQFGILKLMFTIRVGFGFCISRVIGWTFCLQNDLYCILSSTTIAAMWSSLVTSLATDCYFTTCHTVRQNTSEHLIFDDTLHASHLDHSLIAYGIIVWNAELQVTESSTLCLPELNLCLPTVVRMCLIFRYWRALRHCSVCSSQQHEVSVWVLPAVGLPSMPLALQLPDVHVLTRCLTTTVDRFRLLWCH